MLLIDCPMDVMDEIGGWSKQSIGEGYGEGYSISQIKNLMNEYIINYLTNSDNTTPLLV
jgi:hypothetical protein